MGILYDEVQKRQGKSDDSTALNKWAKTTLSSFEIDTTEEGEKMMEHKENQFHLALNKEEYDALRWRSTLVFLVLKS